VYKRALNAANKLDYFSLRKEEEEKKLENKTNHCVCGPNHKLSKAYISKYLLYLSCVFTVYLLIIPFFSFGIIIL